MLDPDDDPLLTPGEVAKRFHVDPKTVARWAAAMRLNSIRTPGGHRRYRSSEVARLLQKDGKSEIGSAAPTPTS